MIRWLWNRLLSFGFVRKYLVNRELRRMELDNLKHDLKVEFATLNQDHWGDSREFYLEHLELARMVAKFGIPEELPTAKDCRVFLYGEDINETIDDYVPAPVQMPNSVSVSENVDGTYELKVVCGEKFRFFSPYEPAFNYNHTKFLWNGIVYIIPQNYYGMPLDKYTMYAIAREIVETQARLLNDLDGD